jgi:hypothetical protein
LEKKEQILLKYYVHKKIVVRILLFPGCKIERDSSNHPETECPSSTHQGASKSQGFKLTTKQRNISKLEGGGQGERA